MTAERRKYLTRKRDVIFLTFGLSILLISAGIMFYKYEENRIRNSKHDELKTIAKLKIDQISEWYKDEMNDAEILARNPILINYINKWLTTENRNMKSDLLQEVASLQEEHDYKNILVADFEGRVILSTNASDDFVDTLLQKQIKNSILTQEVISTDIYINEKNNNIQICFIAPLNKITGVSQAAIMFVIDPANNIYPIIKSWPTSSKTAETILVRRENNYALVLNELRHKSNTALKERIILDKTEYSIVNAVLGKQGIFEGKDYRNEEVLAHLSPIPGAKWFIVSEIDKSEAFSELYFRTFVIVAFVLLLIMLAGSGLVLIYNSRQKNIYMELYNTERKLLESQDEFRTILYSIGDGVITTDVNGKVKQMNHEAERLTGWKEKEAQGIKLEKVFVIVNEKTRETVENPVNIVLREGKVVGLANHTVLISKNNSEVPIADSGSPIKNENNEVSGVVLVFKDQTKEYKSQKALEESEERLRLALQSSGQSIFEHDIIRNELSFTEEYQKILGYELNSLVENASQWIQKVHPDDRDVLRNAYYEYYEHKTKEYNVEFRQKNKNGEWIWFYSRGKIVSFDENGKPLKLVGTLIDITNLKKIEEQLREAKERAENSEKIKSEFLAQMSHEIRSPINVILSYADLIRSNIVDQINKELLPGFESISTAGKRIIRTIDLILNMSDLQLGTYDVVKKEFDVKNLIISLIREYSSAAAKKNLQLNFVEETKNTLLTNDDYAVSQIIANLIDNAIKYTKEGNVDVILYRDEKDNMLVCVSDTGIGISEEYMPKLFTPFSQEEHGYSRTYDGTGLGLALIKKYCEIISADIFVESKKGEGTKFTVLLKGIE